MRTTTTQTNNIRRNQSAEDHHRDFRAVMTVFDAAGIPWSPSKISRTIRGYERVQHTGISFFAYVTNRLSLSVAAKKKVAADPRFQRVLDYGDPTGEYAAYLADGGEPR